jgi:putative membrane protein
VALTAVALAAVVVAAAALVVALVRLHRRGDRWPPWRAAAAVAGLVCLAGAVGLSLAPRAGAATTHAQVHLLAGMAAPLLLALSAPVTLALRTLPPGGRRLLLAAVRSRAAAVLTAPAVVALLDVGGLAVVYLTGLHHHLHHSPLLAAAVHVHLFAAGYLLAAVLAGPDPLPHRPSTTGCLVLLVGVAAAHEVVMVLAYAGALSAPGGADQDGMAGATLMRGWGHLVDAALAVAVMAPWYRRTGRELARERRRAGAAPIA